MIINKWQNTCLLGKRDSLLMHLDNAAFGTLSQCNRETQKYNHYSIMSFSYRLGATQNTIWKKYVTLPEIEK
jgi:hypothetical protein